MWREFGGQRKRLCARESVRHARAELHMQSCRKTIEHAAGRLKAAHQVSGKHPHSHPSVSQREKYQPKHSRSLLQLCIQT